MQPTGAPFSRASRAGVAARAALRSRTCRGAFAASRRWRTMIEAALQYAGRPWRVIPCRSDKVSRIRNWQVAASSDPETIIEWWTQWPNAWIALLCGCSFVVIDVDMGEAHKNVDGFATLAALGPLPGTLCVRTPSAGMHLYLKADRPIRSR